jgi:hypothetical protein
MTAAAGVRLLEADPELGRDLDSDALEQARRAIVVPAIDIPKGPWTPPGLGDPHVHGVPLGVLVIDGTLRCDLDLGGRTCSRLLITGDLLLLDRGESAVLPARWSCSAEKPTRVALLDDRVLAAAVRWPAITRALIGRAAKQWCEGFVLQAIAQLPRVEDRVLALLWSLAERSGRMTRDGVRMDLAMSQSTLGQMVGAQRPTVSLALRQLAVQGDVQRHGTEWLIDWASAVSSPLVGHADAGPVGDAAPGLASAGRGAAAEAG